MMSPDKRPSLSRSVIARAAAGSTVTLLAMDTVWLSQFAVGMYREDVGELMRDATGWDAATAFYLLYVSGILALAVVPALSRAASDGPAAWAIAARHGAMLGFVAYGTFGFTNLAVLEAWTLPLVLVDLVWGVVLTASAATVGALAGSPRSRG